MARDKISSFQLACCLLLVETNNLLELAAEDSPNDPYVY
jgi:hypothetical protein